MVVTGLGVLAANGSGKDEFWRTLVAGESGIAPITLFDASDLPCRIAGEVKDFDPADYIDASLKPGKRMGRFTQLGLAAARLAIEDAALEKAFLARVPDLPVILGVSTSAMDLIGRKPGLFTAVEGIPHAGASAIGYMYNPNPRLLTISDGCASSLDAVAAAANMIRTGVADIALTGGAEGGVERYILEVMLKCRRCSTRNDDPGAASRPFDRDRDYGVMAEGAGIVVLENLEHARARGATIYGEIAGYGACADPVKGQEGEGMADAMRFALANAGVHLDRVDYISAHGPSDIDMDRLETDVIKEVFGDRAYNIPVTSIKGATGCPMGAGGVFQLVATSLTMQHDLIPPTTNYEKPDPGCDLDYVPGQARHARIDNAIINTHGFGRGNGALLLRRVESV